MSTQKRESRYSPAARTWRPGGNCRRRHAESARVMGAERQRALDVDRQVPQAPYDCAGNGGKTAPNLSIFWSIWFWLATNFLLKDQPFRLPVRPLLRAWLPGSPPVSGAAFGKPASSGHPAIPFPPSHACFHPTLPQAPARIRRAERYDGQGNLYLLIAA